MARSGIPSPASPEGAPVAPAGFLVDSESRAY